MKLATPTSLAHWNGSSRMTVNFHKLNQVKNSIAAAAPAVIFLHGLRYMVNGLLPNKGVLYTHIRKTIRIYCS